MVADRYKGLGILNKKGEKVLAVLDSEVNDL